MKVLYDGAIYSLQAVGGANRYFARLIDNLSTDVSPYLTTNYVRSANYPRNPRLRTYYFKRFCFWPGRLAYLSEKCFFRAAMLAQRFDVYHPTVYTENAAQVSIRKFRCPIVVTIHDMIEEIFPERDPGGRRRRQKAEVLEVAAAVICVSNNTKRDLLERYPNLSLPIIVTHLASELTLDMAAGAERVPDSPYFLYVGERHSTYKNFEAVLVACSRIREDCRGVRLCVVGPPLTIEENQRIAALQLTEFVEHWGRPTDRQLAKLYRCSLALVYPSMYEGFGIPPLEAMACGTVAVVSNRASLPEVVGDAGILFDPLRAADLSEIMLSLARREIDREALVKRGLERAGTFSWTRTAAETCSLYRQLGN